MLQLGVVTKLCLVLRVGRGGKTEEKARQIPRIPRRSSRILLLSRSQNCFKKAFKQSPKALHRSLSPLILFLTTLSPVRSPKVEVLKGRESNQSFLGQGVE
ncbi:hypothetical protein MUK42_22692 [Musa troglodytarum]|uniref:Uncharacterized protein n=1 Tax=Musa troglodytarum TaxID=320322 RepID=A0A9E7FSW4_9LILI|nr:hypothetical protein MUK42_22692 [Musa troglodytarum]